MTSTRRRVLLHGALVVALGPAQLARGATLLAVRVWPAERYTRVTLESDAALAASHQLLAHPDRLVIDIDGLELSDGVRELVAKVRADDPFIAAVRVGQQQPRVVRLVFDLRQPTAPEVFGIEPVAAYRHRLVFDLHPAAEPDPLLALLRERDGGAQAARAVNDALGEFIGRLGDVRAPAAPASAAPVPPPAEAASAQARVERLMIVALDPGHGGEDPGAIGPSGLREKDVVLAVALLLRERLEARQGNLRVMLTRDADFFVPLGERVRRARRVQADLFVSIHADAFVDPDARGASVFALSEKGASSSAARWLANRENAADRIGGVNLARSRDAAVVHTLLDMSTAAQIRDSLRLGGDVLARMGGVGRLHKGSVEQAGFAVLKAPDIPSILVETAFISNPQEEARLADPAWRRRLVEALASGIERWFARHPPPPRQRPL